MSGKFNNKILLTVVVVLAALFLVARYAGRGHKEKNLATDIVQIDTTQITSFTLYPRAEQGTALEFSRQGALWTVSREGVTAAADSRTVTAALAELKDLATEQLVARSPEQRAEYQVDDSLGSRIVIREGKKNTLDLVVGRFQYQPPPRNSYNQYGGGQGSGKTYVRLSGEDEIYAVEGYLALSINQAFDRWRDASVTRVHAEQLSRILFDYPADSGYVAEKNDAGWMVAGIMADSASMAAYLKGLSRHTGRDFLDGYLPDGEPDYRVSFEGDNMAAQQVRAYILPDGDLALNSSINPDTWFRSPGDGLFAKLFPAAGSLLGK
jgi:hypothetical protein